MCTTKVLVDANFLVNVNDEDKKLLELMEEYHQVLKITVVLDCLAKVCDDHEKLLSDRFENRIKVISIDSLKPRFRTSKCSIKKYIVLKSPKIIPEQEYFSFH